MNEAIITTDITHRDFKHYIIHPDLDFYGIFIGDSRKIMYVTNMIAKEVNITDNCLVKFGQDILSKLRVFIGK